MEELIQSLRTSVIADKFPQSINPFLRVTEWKFSIAFKAKKLFDYKFPQKRIND